MSGRALKYLHYQSALWLLPELEPPVKDLALATTRSNNVRANLRSKDPSTISEHSIVERSRISPHPLSNF